MCRYASDATHLYVNHATRLYASLQDIVITNIVWCMAYTREVEGGSYIAQYSCNSIATLWGMEVGGWNESTIAYCFVHKQF